MSVPLASVRLSVEIGSDPIAGQLWVQGGEPQDFCGWVELVEAIESVRTDVAAADQETAGRHAA